AVNALTKITSNDDFLDSTTVTTPTSLAVATLTAGTTYYIAIDGFAGAEGNTSIVVSAGPVVSVTAGANVTEGGTTSFTISRTGSSTNAITVYFDYGGSADRGADYNRL